MRLPEWLLRPSPGAVLAVSDGPHAPATLLQALAGCGALSEWTVLCGWLLGPEPAWLSQLGADGGLSVMGSGAARAAVNDGRLRYLPLRLSRLPTLLAELRPEVAVVRARPVDGGFLLAPSVGWAAAAARLARRLVVEVDPTLPDIVAPVLAREPDLVVESTVASVVPARAAVDEVDRRIGALVASLVPDGATIQYGPGSIAEAVVAALDRPVRVFSGMVSDSLVDLADRDLLRDLPVVCAYLHGGDRLHELAASGAVRVAGVEETHDLSAVAAIPRFVALNTAIQVGLDGSVNVEGVSGRTLAGVGGHPDYALAGSLSIGGLSIVAMHSHTASGKSTIVAVVDRVSTAATDVDVVVTEHGIADLRHKDAVQRRDALLDVAAVS